MADTNAQLLNKFKSNSVGFLSVEKVMSLYKNWYDSVGISQQDRYVILKNQIRVVLNMIPINFENFKLNDTKIDFL